MGVDPRFILSGTQNSNQDSVINTQLLNNIIMKKYIVFSCVLVSVSYCLDILVILENYFAIFQVPFLGSPPCLQASLELDVKILKYSGAGIRID